MSTIELTDEQLEGVVKIETWYAQPQTRKQFKLGGYAGTGKTTLLKQLRERLRAKRIASNVCAFTGKATNVLQRKGVSDATTIHSLIYNCEPTKGGGVNFFLKSKYDLKTDLIIVDEASMISTELYEDLTSFGIPLLFVGDPGQLEPVGDNPNLMACPDFILNKIHRQAEASPIITLANNVRHGGTLNIQQRDGLIVRDKKLAMQPLMEHDQVICAKNLTRKNLNQKFRMCQAKPVTKICVEDKLIVLRNNSAYGVFNGMLVFIDYIHEDQELYWLVDMHDEVNNKFSKVPIWKEPFTIELPKEFYIPKYKENQMIYCDFGYAITCHKSQGSEWRSVLVWDEYMPPKLWDMRRWRYTAITRASENLTYCI